MAEIELPDGFQELKTQVAGHTFEASNSKAVGLLFDAKTGCVLKPFGKPECGEREVKFYEKINKALNFTKNKIQNETQREENINEMKCLIELSKLVPKFYRKLPLKVNQRDLMFLQMENLANGMLKPCIMDIKIGRRTWDPLATKEKRDVEETKYVNCKKFLGLCLPGFQVYKIPNGEYIRHGKDYGKQLDVKGFKETMALFLNGENRKNLCEPLIREVLRQLYAVRQWFLKQNLLHFYASSLLLVYDYAVLSEYFESKKVAVNGYLINGNCNSFGNGSCNDLIIPAEIQTNNSLHSPTRSKTKLNSLQPNEWIKIKMIDFAHVFPAENNYTDTNYLFGLENLIKVIEELLEN